MPECKPPTDEEFSLVRRWCATRLRQIRIGFVLLAGALIVMAVWGAASPSTRDLALGHGERVTTEIQGQELVGSCGGVRYPKGVPRYRYAVEVVKPGESGLGIGRVTAVTLCGSKRTGSRVEVTALPNGSLTSRTASGIWIVAGVAVTVGMAGACLLRLLRRRVSRILDLCDDPAAWTPTSATLQSKFRIRSADVSTAEGARRLQLGPALTRPDGTLVRWRLQRVGFEEHPSVTLLIPNAPGAGFPVLLEDGVGERHWRTLTNVRG